MTISIATLAAALERAGLLRESRGALPDSVTSITDDSRAIGEGTLFIAVRGSVRDGHDFLDQVAAAGAPAVIVEDPSLTSLPALVVREGESRRAAAVAAAAAYGEPARELRLIGVTGTNGKTTTVNMLRHLLDGDGGRSASIGTLGALVGSEGEPVEGGSGLTTPGPVELQRLLRELRSAGVRTVAMEVSSHSLHQRRVEGVKFDAAVFTNLTRDHLDYHKSMEAYFEAKALLASQVGLNGALVVNEDDEAWRALPRRGRRIGYSVNNQRSDVHASDVRYDARGTSLLLVAGDDRIATRVPLIGDFNVANALGAAAAAWGVGLAPAEIAARLATLPQVPGRLEVIHEGPTVLRDYAHTPDALERSLRAVRPFARGRLIVLFGAGGDRDRGKRPQMGEIAGRLADFAIVTSDNPRTEDPERILDDIEGGMKGANRARIADRREAIAHALAMAGEQDVILLAGKGHETYQVRGTEKLPFDERLIVRELAHLPGRTA